MNVVGLIVEYNPLHNGHVYHFEQAKRMTHAEASVAVMSGSFLQRGEPALLSKWARAQMALEMGADLVIELPYVYATRQAQYFAYGAVSILDRLPFVTHLCFGSESGDIDAFRRVSRLLAEEPQRFRQSLKQNMKKGKSYPKAYGEALQQLLTERHMDPSLAAEPNNILGLHYLLALSKWNSSIRPTTLKREKAGYHDVQFSDRHIASATSIRQALFSTTEPDWSRVAAYVPSFTLEIMKAEHEAGRGPVRWEDYFPYIIHSLFSQSASHLESIYEMEEGIEHRFKEKAKWAESMEHLCQLVKSKRYTWNRIQRMLVHILTQFQKTDLNHLHVDEGASYIRLLGFSATGRQLLNKYKPHIPLPLVADIKKNQPAMLEWDMHAALLHTLAYTPQAQMRERKRELIQSPLSPLFADKFRK